MFSSIFGKKKKTASKKNNPSPHTAKVHNPYQAVRIVFKPGSACTEVQIFKGKAFLGHEAPTLPLPNCSHKEQCHCVYKHMADRRTGLRRDSDHGLLNMSVPIERRQRKERRAFVG